LPSETNSLAVEVLVRGFVPLLIKTSIVSSLESEIVSSESESDEYDDDSDEDDDEDMLTVCVGCGSGRIIEMGMVTSISGLSVGAC
jgi:hypothetical protein